MAAGWAPFLTFAGPSLPFSLEKKLGMVEAGLLSVSGWECVVAIHSIDLLLPRDQEINSKGSGVIRASPAGGIDSVRRGKMTKYRGMVTRRGNEDPAVSSTSVEEVKKECDALCSGSAVQLS